VKQELGKKEEREGEMEKKNKKKTIVSAIKKPN